MALPAPLESLLPKGAGAWFAKFRETREGEGEGEDAEAQRIPNADVPEESEIHCFAGLGSKKRGLERVTSFSSMWRFKGFSR